jgi:hypothetical protein
LAIVATTFWRLRTIPGSWSNRSTLRWLKRATFSGSKSANAFR